MTWTRNQKIALASVIVPAVLASVGLVAQKYQKAPSESSSADSATFIAGTAVDRQSRFAVGQVRVGIIGRPESTLSDDNGNFRIDFKGPVKDRQVRIHASKDGYEPVDLAVLPPVADLFLLLKRAH